MNNFSTWLTVVMLAIFTSMVGVATTYPTGAQFMPFVVGIPGILLCALQLSQDFIKYRRGAAAGHFQPTGQAGVPASPEDEEAEFGPHTVKNEITMWIYLVAYITGVLLFGFLIAVPLLVAIYLHLEAKVSLLRSIIAALAAVTVMYLAFENVLRFKLHAGFITSSVIKSLGL